MVVLQKLLDAVTAMHQMHAKWRDELADGISAAHQQKEDTEQSLAVLGLVRALSQRIRQSYRPFYLLIQTIEVIAHCYSHCLMVA